MKVLQINSVCGIRSTGRIATDLADVLSEQGHECKIAYGREVVPERYQKYAVRIGRPIDVRLHALGSRIFDNTGFYSTAATKRFLSWVDEYKPDIIHLHNIHGYYINMELLFNYIKTNNLPVVWTLHDCWAFTGHCAHFAAIGCEKWRVGCEKCCQKREYPVSLVRDNSMENYKKKSTLFNGIKNMTIITPSKWLAQLVKQSFLGGYSIKVIPNGIDLSVFKPTKSDLRNRYGLQNKTVILGVASAWGPKKGLSDLIKLSAMLNKNNQIVLIGLSKKQIKTLPSEMIGITGTNSAEELAQWYTAADVFVNPSVEETMGLTTVEAMACGTPAIVYNKTALPETVNLLSGIVIEDNIARLSTTIQIQQYKQCTTEECLNHAKHFAKNDAFAEYFNIYSKALAKEVGII